MVNEFYSKNIPLDRKLSIASSRYVICYPKPQSHRCDEVVNELLSIGIDNYIPYGETILGQYRILGRGWSTNVFLATWRRRKIVAVKVLHPNSRRKTILKEALFWLIASHYNIAPEYYTATKNVLVVEPVLGPKLKNYRPNSCSEYKYIVRRILWKTYLLDKLGIRHGELARPWKQILVDTEKLEPYIVDYDAATTTHPNNLTQLLGGLLRSKLSSLCLPRVDKKYTMMRKLLKQYKKEKSIEIVERLEASLGI